MKSISFLSKFIFTLLLILAFSSPSDAQIYEIINHIKRAASAREHIQQLHDGTMMVRLRSKKNNIEAMEKSLAREGISGADRRRLEKRLNKTIEIRDKENKEIVASIQRYYKFSDYLFVYDSDIRQLYDHEKSGYFLNDQLEIDSNITIDLSKPFYVLGYGRRDPTNENRLEGLILSDSNKVTLESPFPYFSRTIWPPLSSLGSFVGKNEMIPNYSTMVQRFSFSIDRFYSLALIKREKDKLRQEIKDLKN